MKLTLTKVLSLLGVLFAFSACSESPSSAIGKYEGYSYSAYWSGSGNDVDDLRVLIISDYNDDDSLARGQSLYGDATSPISGYHDRDGEVVTYAMIGSDTILILDKYFDIEKAPAVFYVYRDNNELLDVVQLGLRSEIFESVFAGISLRRQ